MRQTTRSSASLPTTCAHTWSTASGTTGLTLPGMIDEPGCRSGNRISASPAIGPEFISRRSLHTLVSDDGEHPQLPGHLDERVLCRLGLDVVARLGERHARRRGQLLDDGGAQSRRGVDPGADRGPAQWQRPTAVAAPTVRAPRRARPAQPSRSPPGRA